MGFRGRIGNQDHARSHAPEPCGHVAQVLRRQQGRLSTQARVPDQAPGHLNALTPLLKMSGLRQWNANTPRGVMCRPPCAVLSCARRTGPLVFRVPELKADAESLKEKKKITKKIIKCFQPKK